MDHHRERRARRRALTPLSDSADQIARQGRGRQAGQRRDRPAGGGGVRGVGLDQDLGVIAARHAPREVGRNGQGELDLAARHGLVQLAGRGRGADDLEIAGVDQGRQGRTRHRSLVLDQNRGRQVAGIVVDRIAEQQQLHDRHHQDHGVGQPVAGELDELLDQHGQDARAGKTSGGPAAIRRPAHWKLSDDWLISRMNTSSSVGATSVQLRGGRR